jgi:hypothetical protein
MATDKKKSTTPKANEGKTPLPKMVSNKKKTGVTLEDRPPVREKKNGKTPKK